MLEFSSRYGTCLVAHFLDGLGSAAELSPLTLDGPYFLPRLDPVDASPAPQLNQ